MDRLEALCRFLAFASLILAFCAPQAQAQLSGVTRDQPLWEDIFRRATPVDVVDQHRGSNSGFGFGKKFAGTWMGMGSFDLDFDCDGVVDVPAGIPVLDLHTFDVGGSHTTTNPNNPNTIRGTWERTDVRQLTSEAVGFGSSPNCVDTTDPPDGVCDSFGPLVSVFRIKTVVDFDEDFQTATTTFGATVYAPTEDPLDPAGFPTICTIGAHTSFRKVNVPE